MNVLSLFDGMSCGQIALNRAGIKYDNYFAAEIDKPAITVTKANYPNTQHLGDVTTIKGENLPKIDLLIGGSPCFTKGTKIICENELKNIEDIKVGDKVLTHKGNYKKVLKIGGTSKEIHILKSQGAIPTETTSNHPYFIRKRSRHWDKYKRKYVYSFTTPSWVEVKDIAIGDFVGTPIIKTNSNPFNLTEDECFLIGLYIGDGHTAKGYRKEEGREKDRIWQLIISVGSHQKDEFKSNVNLPYSFYPHTQSVYRANFCSKRLVNLVESNCGIGAKQKYLSKTILDLPTPLLKRVLDGYEFSDGSRRKNVYRATTISKKLVYSLSLAVAKVYKTTCCIEFTKRPKKTTISGRVVNQNDTWVISYRKEHTKQSRAYVLDDIVWNPVKSIEKTNLVDIVYNIEVAHDNSYIANNHIVHNCQGFSFAGKQLNFDDPRSKLFFEFVRLLKECKPKYFLLENVRMKKEHEQVITEHLGVTPITINSSLVSAQNRVRLYWTNIPNVTQPEDRGILLKDILIDGSNQIAAQRGRYLIEEIEQEDGTLITKPTTQVVELRPDSKSNTLTTVQKDNLVVLDKYKLSDKAIEYMNRLRNGKPRWEYHTNKLDGKAACLTANMYKGVPYGVVKDLLRRLTPIECERLQTVPENFSKFGMTQYLLYICPEKNVKLLDAVQTSAVEKQDYATNIIFDLSEMEQLKEKVLIEQKSATIVTAKILNKLLKDIALLTTKDLSDMEHQNSLIRLWKGIKNVNIVIKRLEKVEEQEGCVIDITKTRLDTRTLYTQIINAMTLNQTGTMGKLVVKQGTDISWSITWEDTLNVMKLYIILTLIKQIIYSKIYMYVKVIATIKSAMFNFSISEQNYLNVELLDLMMENISLSKDSHRYKMLGNGWTVDVISYIFENIK